MSAAEATVARGTGSRGPLTDPSRRPSLTRLLGVEARKMVDTRAGKWLFALTVLAAFGGVVLALISPSGDDPTTAEAYLTAASLVSTLLPVIGVLLVTSEWSQRTALITFTVVPARGRVFAGKLLAALSVAAAFTVACLVLAAIGTVVAGEGLEISLAEIGQGFVYQAIVVAIGLALGLALMSSPLAIVTYFAGPLVFGIIGAVSASVGDAMAWVDQSALIKLGELDPSGEIWAKAGVTALVWFALPLAAGLVRLLRRDID